MRLCSVEGCENVHLARGWCRKHYLRWHNHGDPLFTVRWQPYDVRFWRLVDQADDGCWPWLGSLADTGYGQFAQPNGITGLAHRIAYELAVGPIPDGLHLDHLCRNRRCVRPDHLEPVTPAENNRRSDSPSALNATKTHCKRGHPFDPDNTYVWRGERRCRECMRAQNRRWRARQQGAAA